MEHGMTTTAFTLDGYQVVRTLGVVRGITVRSRSIFGTLAGSLQTIRGGKFRSSLNFVRRRAKKHLRRCWHTPGISAQMQ